VVDNLTDEIGFDGRHQRYCYNVVGELTHVIETGGSDLGPGKVTHLERDVLGRLLAKRCEGEISNNDSDTTDTTDTTSTTFTYDPLGRLTAAINPAAHLRFGYDAIGQIISETQEMGSASGSSTLKRQLSHSYDALGNRLQTLLPDGRSLNWLFYGSGHLHQINLDGEVLADIERDALHRETSRSQGSLNSQFDYDPAGRLVRHRASAQRAVNAVLERAYAYDATGQLVERADSLRGRQDFRYDPVGRILSALPSAFTGTASTHQSELFAFDPAGNLLPENNIKNNSSLGNEYAGYSQNSTQNKIIPDNRLKVYQDLAFAYDAHGNVTQRIRGNQAAGTHSDASFIWNADHQLAAATVSRHGFTQTTRYAYDALGRRVTKADSFGATHYLWDGDLMVHSQRGSKEALFVFEPNSFVPLATVQGTKNDKQTYWYQCDQIGAPQELTDAQGNIVWAADYKVWGEAKVRQITLPQSYRTGTDDYSANDFTPKRGGTWKLAGDSAAKTAASNAPPPIEQPFRFQGQQFDEETGLHYNRFRYYDPVIGRFVSQDPIGLMGGFNTSSYAPNPFDWLNPLGLAAAGQLGTYGGLTGEGHKDDKLDAHELLRNKALEQMGCKSGKRMDDNPSIAIGRGQHVNVHRQETALSQQHLGTNGKNEFQFGADGKPTNRQMDVWQGALRKSGMGASQAKRLRKQSNNYLKSLCCCP
jgi:RHS repeat-associated protein